jgi:hypothetical protein
MQLTFSQVWIVHRVTRPLRGSVSCDSGWSVPVPCVSIQLTLSQVWTEPCVSIQLTLSQVWTLVVPLQACQRQARFVWLQPESPTRIAVRTREVRKVLSASRKRSHGTHAAAWQRFDERHNTRPARKLAATPNARLCHTEPGARARRDARPQLDHDLCCVHDGSRSRSVFNRTCSDVAMTSHTRSRSRCYQLPRSSRGTRGYFAA